MKIKHLIITRFFPVDMGLGERLLDYDFLHENITILKNYLLCSLKNQTNKQFDFVLIINDTLDEKNAVYEELFNIKCEFKTHLVKHKDYVHFLNKIYDNYDYVITTRIDHDDLVYKDAVENIQNKIDENYDIVWQGLNNGATIIKNNINNVYKFSPKYKNDDGAISIFQSVIVNTKMFNGKVNIYNGPHTETINRLKGVAEQKNAKIKLLYNDTELTWLYVNHNTNISVLNKKANNENWHRSKIKIEKPTKYWNEMFGLKL